ncbi:hypothetical protein LguiA_033583 [Lonicera macranthoides]
MDILARLPLKNIVQCTIVCKSWYSLITSPNFITTHLNRSIAQKESRILIRESIEKAGKDHPGKENYSVHWDNVALDEYAKFDFPYSSMTSRKLRIVGTCNGLVTMYLWNPSIGKFVTVPGPDITFWSHGSYSNSYGFGFDTTTDDYKVVRLVHLENDDDTSIVPPEVELYELSTGADLLIATFDMRNEALGVMMGPLCVRAMMDWDTRLQVYGESLSFMHKPINDGSCNIWVMKEYGVAESWTKQFTIDLSKVDSWRPSYFRENGNIFLVTYGGYLHSGFGDGGNLLCYDPKSKQIKKVEGKEVVSFVGTYRESLVLLKGLNGVLAKHGNFGVAVTSGGTSLSPREKNDDKANQLEENEGRM